MENINKASIANKKATPALISSLQCKCPRCREGNMFVSRNPYNLKQTLNMHKECPVCKQPFELEVGFYYGSSYVSYAMSVALSVASLIGWWLFVGLSIYDNRFIYWLVFNAALLIVLQPLLMRLARSIWLAFFVRYDKDWQTKPPEPAERTNKDQMNNW
jgi:uncharacterized protein (DUF983 family)